MTDSRPYLVAYYKDYEKGCHVSAVADRFLFEGSEDYGGQIVLLSALGPHSAVRGILAAAATGREIHVDRYPRGRFYSRDGGRILTAALGGGVIHGCYVGPRLLEAEEDRFAILGSEPRKVFDRLCRTMALPALPEWAEWICGTLKSKRFLVPLCGMGATGCTIQASEEELDRILSEGVKRGALKF
jgi:hypothetical protein